MDRAQSKGNSAALVIILIMLLGIVGYFVIVPAPYREGQLPDIPAAEYNNVVLDASPGKFEPTKEERATEKINLPAIFVDNTPQTAEQLINEQVLVKKSLFQATYKDFDFNINKAVLSEARLHFTVSEKIGNGVINVLLNQNIVFSRTAGEGETLDIVLPDTYLQGGMNTLRISMLGGSLFQTKTYVLTDVKLVTDEYTDKEVEQSFSVTKNAAKNIEEARLIIYIKSLEEAVNLQLALNGEQMFNALPPESFELQLPINLLQGGANTLSWSADRNGRYSLQYGVVMVKELEIEEGGKKYYFSMGYKDAYFARQTKKYACELYLLKQSGADEITVSINSEAHTYAFDNGEIKADICSALVEGTNRLVLSVDEDTTISDLVLTVKNK